MRLRFSKWLPAAVHDGRRPLRKICRSPHAPAAFTRGGHCRRFGGGQRSKAFFCRPIAVFPILADLVEVKRGWINCDLLKVRN